MTWRYVSYVTPSGQRPVELWLATQDDEVVAALQTTLYERRELSDWLNPPTKHAKKQFKVLDQEHAGLSELRFWTTGVFTGARRVFRVAGDFRPTEKTFVLFTGCEKMNSGQTEVPPDAFDMALAYKAALGEGRGTLIDHT